MSETAEFRCVRCGRCCSVVLTDDRGISRGLTLLPEETHVFPEDVVRPAIGIGKTPQDPGFRVLVYQLAVEPCPHLRENGCAVYGDRPAGCRQFPFSLEPSGDGGQLLGVDLNCISAAKLLDSCTQIRFDGREAAVKLLRIKEQVAECPGQAWFYDLGTEIWVNGERLG